MTDQVLAEQRIGQNTEVTLHFALRLENGDTVDSTFDKAPATFKVGDGGVTDRYVANVSGQSLARTALVPTGFTYTGVDTIDLTWTSGGGSPTTGAGTLRVMYILDGRAHAVQPT